MLKLRTLKMWTDQVLYKLSHETTYSRGALFSAMQAEKKDINASTFRWTLYNLLQNQKLFKVDFDTYVLEKPQELVQYRPYYSELAMELIKKLEARYKGLNFVIFESFLLNEFLNHQLAQNTIYLQVEKEVSSYIFDILKDEYPKGVLYKPSLKDFDRYWTNDCIVVLDLISQSPTARDRLHDITVEKLLVDIISEKSISAIFSQAELPFVFENVLEKYRVDRHKVNRYAGRRGKGLEIGKYLGGADVVKENVLS